MKKVFLFASLALFAITAYGQTEANYLLANRTSIRKPQEYLTMAYENNSASSERDHLIVVINSDTQIQKNYQGKRRLFVSLTIPLIAGYLIANQTNNKDLAAGFAVGGLVTSSLGLYFMIKEDKQKKNKN